MKRTKLFALGVLFSVAASVLPGYKVSAAVQTPISRSQAEQRALNMINLSWTYSSSLNGNINSSYSNFVTKPSQLVNATSNQMTGIPYDWGGLDGLDSSSYYAPWSNFLDAVSKGAYIGNVNTDAGYGLIPGTAGIDCSGFVQAAFNIKDDKLSTSTMFNTYFTKIALSDIKHMDILDRPGDHVVIFDKWGTMNGISGAFTYEATPDQTFGGIQGTKKYFLTMSDLNNGYIPGRYINVMDDQTASQPSGQSGVTSGIFAMVSNVNSFANFRSNPSISANLLGTIPKNSILYLISGSSGWYQVKYNDQVGWIYGNVLSTIPNSKYATVNNVTMLNIRTSPSSGSQIVGTLSQGQYAEVLGYSSDGLWMNIKINGVQGYSYAKYLSYIQ